MLRWIGVSLLGSLVVVQFVFPNVDLGKLIDIWRPKISKEWIGDCVVYTDRDTGRTVNKECTQKVVRTPSAAIHPESQSGLSREQATEVSELIRGGYTYLNRRHFDHAIKYFTLSLELQETSTAYRLRGRAYQENGESEQALVDLTKAIQLDPSDAGQYFWRSAAYRNLEKQERANADLKVYNDKLSEPNVATAEERPHWETPNSCKTVWSAFTPKSEGTLPVCHTNREWRVCKEERREPLYAWWCPKSVSAGRDREDSLLGRHGTDPESRIDAHLRTGNAYRVSGNSAGAMHHFNIAIELDHSNPEAFLGRGLVYRDLVTSEANIKSALANFMKCIAIDPSNVRAHFELGLLFFHNINLGYDLGAHNWHAAVVHFERVLELDQQHTSASANLARLRAMAIKSGS